MEHSKSRALPFPLKLFRLKDEAPVLFRVLIILFVFEVIVSVIAPLFIPRTWYLSRYLSDTATVATQQFLDGQGVLIPDDHTGWKNSPNMERKNWIVDGNGSRSTHTFTTRRTKPVRALFLGSSMINGGTGITNDETVSAFLEDADIEALNFGTMMYSIDQSFLAYRHRLHDYNANVIVVGLDADPISGLKNHYVPFRSQMEENMPFVKPRFVLDSESLRLVTVSPLGMLSDIPNSPAFIDFLAENDSFYFNFESYRRAGFLPFSAGFRFLYFKFRNLSNRFKDDLGGSQVLEAIMKEMVDEATRYDAKPVFLMLPDQDVFAPAGIDRIFPDKYAERYHKLQSAGFNVIDTRQILRESGKSANELFYADRVHYNPLANEIIGRALRPIIGDLCRDHSE